MTNNQKQFLESIIEQFKFENEFECKKYNIPFRILSLVEKLENPSYTCIYTV